LDTVTVEMKKSSPPSTSITPTKKETSRLFARLSHRNANNANNNDSSSSIGGKKIVNNNSKKGALVASTSSQAASATNPLTIELDNDDDSVLLKFVRVVKLYVLKKFLRNWSQLATEIALKEVIPQKKRHAGRIRQLSKNLDTTEQDIALTLMMANEVVDGFNEFSNIMRTIDFNTLDDLTSKQNMLFDEGNMGGSSSDGKSSNTSKHVNRSTSRPRYYVDSVIDDSVAEGEEDGGDDEFHDREMVSVERKKNEVLNKRSEDFDFLNSDISDILSVSSMIKNDIRNNNNNNNHLNNHKASNSKTPVRRAPGSTSTTSNATTNNNTNKQLLTSTEESVINFEERLKSANKKIKSLENMYLYTGRSALGNDTTTSTQEDLSMVSQSDKEVLPFSLSSLLSSFVRQLFFSALRHFPWFHIFHCFSMLLSLIIHVSE
jgi:hypothetical protein